MSKFCSECGKPIYRYNRSGYCKPCGNRSPAMRAAVAKSVASRLEMLKNLSIIDRLAKFRVVRGDDECWGWSGSHTEGYGVIRVNSELRMATHLALESVGKPRPSPAHVACHSCDNPPCTNPSHLWWGTEIENMQDAAQKGRLPGNKTSRGGRGWKADAPIRANFTA